MELFRSLRLRAGRALLAKKLSRNRRQPFYIDFYNIKSIGLVWDASKTEDFITLSRFHQKMADLKIEVKIFGFFPGKNLPDQYTAIRFLTCLKKREVDFFYMPVSSESSSFIDRYFDVLIDINFNKLFPLTYISSLSNARLKVSLADSKPETSQFDLMISLMKPVKLDAYLDQVLFYLDMIKSESAKKVI